VPTGAIKNLLHNTFCDDTEHSPPSGCSGYPQPGEVTVPHQAPAIRLLLSHFSHIYTIYAYIYLSYTVYLRKSDEYIFTKKTNQMFTKKQTKDRGKRTHACMPQLWSELDIRPTQQ
jgi:hypothetical protein